MKQTAVEWLIQQLSKEWQLEDRDLYLIEQAKQMELKQREKDFVQGYKQRALSGNKKFDEISEIYAKELFNETFKSK